MAERCCSIADLGLWPVPYHDWNPYLPPHLPALPHCVPHHDWAPYPPPPLHARQISDFGLSAFMGGTVRSKLNINRYGGEGGVGGL